MTRVLAAAGLIALTGLAALTLYGIAMYRELQRPLDRDRLEVEPV